MIKKTTLFFIILFANLLITNNTDAQNNIKYGPDYVVFEAEDTNTDLGNLWTVRKPEDATYLKYLFYPGESPDPINNTYLEYTGPWQGAGSELEYKFTCPKTGTYQIAMRLHTPLRASTNANKGKWLTPPGETEAVWWELADLRNDFYVKMEGNYTSGSAKHSESDLRTFHKFFGRGANKWGTCINLEHNGNNGLFYNLVEGEEYTFYLKGRSNTAIVDYIAFYDTSYLTHSINNQGPDLALQLPEEILPYGVPTAMSLSPNPGNLRVGKTLQLETVITPANGNPNATWTSSNNAIITVNENGLATAQGTIGEKATITATNKFDNSLIASTEITLISDFSIPVTSVSITSTSTSIVAGSSETLTATILPSDADNKNITWSTTDASIATVDVNGNVTGIAEGSVKIRATSVDNNSIFAETDVTITQDIPQAVSINKINGMSLEDFKISRAGKIEIDEVLNLEVSYSNITEYSAGFGRVVVRYAINNGGTAVNPGLNINNIVVGAAAVTETVNYTVANHNTGNSSEAAVLQIFAALNFGGISTLYSGFEVVQSGTLSTKNKVLENAITVHPNPANDYFVIKTDKNVSNLETTIFDVTGKQVYAKPTSVEKIFTDSFMPGLYIIQLKGDGILVHKKLVIK